MLKSQGLVNDFNVTTHDLYYSNKDLAGMTEGEMKDSCIRLRSCNNKPYIVQNNLIPDLSDEVVPLLDLISFERKISEFGYKKVFDTTKKDHHYSIVGADNKIQLQEIRQIGLVVYYDNRKYYDYPLNEQRQRLIDDLNMYGFDFEYDTLGIDKLRTLYYGEEMYSNNQNI